MRDCKWHKCTKGPGGARARFRPRRRDQEFCSSECRNARAAWRQARGSVIVDLLLDANWTELEYQRALLLRETGESE